MASLGTTRNAGPHLLSQMPTHTLARLRSPTNLFVLVTSSTTPAFAAITFSGANGSALNSTSFLAQAGAAINLDSSGIASAVARIANNSPVTVNNGIFTIKGGTTTTTPATFTQNAGTLTRGEPQSSISALRLSVTTTQGGGSEFRQPKPEREQHVPVQWQRELRKHTGPRFYQLNIHDLTGSHRGWVAQHDLRTDHRLRVWLCVGYADYRQWHRPCYLRHQRCPSSQRLGIRRVPHRGCQRQTEWRCGRHSLGRSQYSGTSDADSCHDAQWFGHSYCHERHNSFDFERH